ncbi:MAG: ABC transporter substrate-binding protein, partial [Actinopolymorphaceae bacterium]
MTRGSAVRRRSLLRASAVLAAAASLGSCSGGGASRSGRDAGSGSAGGKGSPTKPFPVPRSLHEAPMLATQVKAGDLPPLAKRLPDHPYVVPHRWQRGGRYGGVCRLVAGATNDAAIGQYMYGHSILRWLNDGMDVGPGLAESWEPNDDFSQWTFHFRTGLRWSDGTPWTTADIMYWWDDTVLDESHPEVPPDEAVSGTGGVAELSAPDDHTLVITFDSPTPLTPDRLADTVNRSVGADWMLPRHYLEKFHPEYSRSVTADDWYLTHDSKADHLVNPDCPVMTGWMLTTYTEGRNVSWERNPYYWCVDRAGNQLPFMDKMIWNVVTDEEVRKLQFTEGRVDFAEGQHSTITLADVEGLKETASRTGLR